MAKVDKKGFLHGKVGPVVYSVKRQQQFVSEKATDVKQTSATKESALEFGLASSSAFVIRDAFSSICFMSDLGMINRLNVAVLRCIKGNRDKVRGERDLHDGDLSELKGFQFNANSPLDQVLSVRPACTLGADRRIQVHVPAFRTNTELKHAKNSNKCTMRLMLMVLNYREQYFECLDHTDLSLDQYNTPKSFDWSPEKQIPDGCIALVSLSLHYFGYSPLDQTHVLLNSRDFNPSEIIGAFSIGASDESSAHREQKTGKKMRGYKGEEILNKIAKIRKSNKGSVKASRRKLPDRAEVPLVVPKGRIRFR